MRYQWRDLAIGVVFGIGIGSAGMVYGQAAVERNVLQQTDVTDVNGKVAVMGTATFPAGASIGKHFHNGDEIGYVVEGQLTVKVDGKPDLPLKAGQSFMVPHGMHHLATAGASGAKIVSVWIIDKGTQLATPVQ